MNVTLPSRLALTPIIFVLAILSWSPRPAYVSHSFTPGISVQTTETEILFYINDYRGKKGLPALEMNSEMSRQAEKHSMDMATNKVGFGHDGFEGRAKYIADKIGNIRSSAENVAYGNLKPKEVVEVWLKSAGHRKNIEGKFKYTGIGVAEGKDHILFFTQIFTG